MTSKDIILTVTTGRSGTQYLAYLLSLYNDLRSEHESLPAFHDYYRDIQNGRGSYKDFWIKEKLPYINRLKESHYSDVSHVACKGFIEPLLDLGVKPKLIFLKRNNRDVAKSLLELGTIPSRTELGLKYLSCPTDINSLKINQKIDKLSDYQLCYWYTLDIDYRMTMFKKVSTEFSLVYMEIDFSDLINDPHILSRMKHSLNLPNVNVINKIKYLKNRQTPKNQKMKSKRHQGEIDFSYEEDFVKNIIQWN